MSYTRGRHCMKYVFVDFEMNLIDSEHGQEKKICKSEIIEIGAVKLDDNYDEIDSFQTGIWNHGVAYNKTYRNNR